ncbi:type II toxin-antitoxin system RelE/ParE family toxin [Polymorphobacter sp. PAMC 29334]|uniref:type II toxin-antitoxin system RelE/ParE family toxin n=1 Tax=Polymorphobacter sp. PAMC 29334 TaxID=2862331 RepID=UPI00351D3953
MLDYGAAHWGIDRAVAYLAIFDDQFTRLAEFPFLGTLRPDVGDGVRSLSLGSHITYFRSERDAVTIARILHRRMAPAKHF